VRLTGTLAVVVSLFWATHAQAEWVDWISDAELALQTTDNLNLSAFSADREDDTSLHGVLRGGRVYQLADRTRLRIVGVGVGEHYEHWDKLDAAGIGGELGVRHKFGVGGAPWLDFAFTGSYRWVERSQRSGRRFQVGVRSGKRFSPRIDGSFGYSYTDRDGDSGPAAAPLLPTNVFDQSYHLLDLTGNFLLLDPLLLTAGYTLRLGEFDSACTVGNVNRVFQKADVKAISLDPVFGGCVYRLEGNAHAARINLSYGFNAHLSFDASYRYQWGEADSLTYRANTGRLTLVFRY
jgi:hypothetical protein